MIGRLSTQFSTVITKLTPQERYWLDTKYTELCELAETNVEPEKLADIGELEKEVYTCGHVGFRLQFGDDDGEKGLHANIYSGVGNPDTVAQFMQLFLRGFRPNDVLHFQWAITSAAICDVDAFTGGAAIVDSVSIKTITTAEWIQQHMEPKPKKKGAKSA